MGNIIINENGSPYLLSNDEIVVERYRIYPIWEPTTNNGKNEVENWSDCDVNYDGSIITLVDNVSTGDGGPWVSIDGGLNWVGTTILNSHRVSISGVGDRQFLTTTNGSTYWSNTSGITWFLSLGLPGTDVKISGDGNYGILTRNTGGIWVYNGSWTQISIISGYVSFGCAAISHTGQYITVGTNNSSGSRAIFVSNDYGVNWTLGTNVPSSLVSASMSNDGKYQLVTATNGNTFVSTDYGVNWNTNGSSQQDCDMSNDGLLQTTMNTSGVLYISTNQPSSWYLSSSPTGTTRISVNGNVNQDWINSTWVTIVPNDKAYISKNNNTII